jgi:hypothetical protein
MQGCFRMVWSLNRVVAPRRSRRDEYGACGSDLAQHGRDRIDQGAAICSRMASLQRGLG